MANNWVIQLRNETQNYLNEMASFEKEFKRLETLLEKIQTDYTPKLKTIFDETKAEIDAVDLQIEEIRKTCDDYCEEQIRLKNENGDQFIDLYEEGKDNRVAKSKITKQIKAKKAEIEAIQSKIKAVLFWKSYKEEKEKIALLQNEITELQQKYDSVNNELDAKKAVYKQKEQRAKELDKLYNQLHDKEYQLTEAKATILHKYLAKCNEIYAEMLSEKYSNTEYEKATKNVLSRFIQSGFFFDVYDADRDLSACCCETLVKKYHAFISFMRMAGAALPSEYDEHFMIKDRSIPCAEISNKIALKLENSAYTPTEIPLLAYGAFFDDWNYERKFKRYKESKTNDNMSGHQTHIKLKNGFDFGLVTFEDETGVLLCENMLLTKELSAGFTCVCFSRDVVTQIRDFAYKLPDSADLSDAVKQLCAEQINGKDELREMYVEFERLYRETPEQARLTDERYFRQKQLDEQRAMQQRAKAEEELQTYFYKREAMFRCMTCVYYQKCFDRERGGIINCPRYIPR